MKKKELHHFSHMSPYVRLIRRPTMTSKDSKKKRDKNGAWRLMCSEVENLAHGAKAKTLDCIT
jgi:hypothetical protein